MRETVLGVTFLNEGTLTPWSQGIWLGSGITFQDQQLEPQLLTEVINERYNYNNIAQRRLFSNDKFSFTKKTPWFFFSDDCKTKCTTQANWYTQTWLNGAFTFSIHGFFCSELPLFSIGILPLQFYVFPWLNVTITQGVTLIECSSLLLNAFCVEDAGNQRKTLLSVEEYWIF